MDDYGFPIGTVLGGVDTARSCMATMISMKPRATVTRIHTAVRNHTVMRIHVVICIHAYPRNHAHPFDHGYQQ